MNRRQLRIVAVAAVAVASVSVAGAVFPGAIGGQTQSVSSGVFVDEDTTLEDPPGPSGINFSGTPWLEAYYQFFEPPNGTAAETGSGGAGTAGGVDLLPVLAAVGSVLTVLTGLGAVVWVRWLWATPEGFAAPPEAGRADPEPTDERPVPVGDLDPSNEVYGAWCELVRRLEVTRPAVMTPRELARAAVDQDFDPEAVESLTRAFEAVRYGRTAPTADHEFRAKVALERLTGEDDP
jgi:hypothetical protein